MGQGTGGTSANGEVFNGSGATKMVFFFFNRHREFSHGEKKHMRIFYGSSHIDICDIVSSHGF